MLESRDGVEESGRGGVQVRLARGVGLCGAFVMVWSSDVGARVFGVQHDEADFVVEDKAEMGEAEMPHRVDQIVLEEGEEEGLAKRCEQQRRVTMRGKSCMYAL